MPWRDEAERVLPPPRRSEPPNLRADILDELADHLALAADRERNVTANAGEDAVWARVLEQFGDPQALARRLWWDAMKETVMREWIKMSAVVAVGLAVVVFLGLMFRQMQAMNQTLISVIQQQKATGTAGTATLEVTVRRGAASGPPVPNIAVSLNGSIFRNEADTVTKNTDTQGRVSFGPMQFGNFDLSLNDAETWMKHNRQVTLFGGDTQVVVVAPEVGFTEVKVDVGTPALADDAIQGVVLESVAQWGDKENLWEWRGFILAGREHTSQIGASWTNGAPSPKYITIFGFEISMPFGFSTKEYAARIAGTSLRLEKAIPVLYVKEEQFKNGKNTWNTVGDYWVVPGNGSFGCGGFGEQKLQEQVFPLQPGASVSLQVALPKVLNRACAYLAHLAAGLQLTPILSPDMLHDVLTRYPDWVPVSAKPTTAMASIFGAEGKWSLDGPFVNECYLWDNDKKMIVINSPLTSEELAALPPDSKVVLAFTKTSQDNGRPRVPEEGLEAYALADPWIPAGWPDSFPKDRSELPCTLARAGKPFLELDAQAAMTERPLFLDVTSWLRGGDGAQPNNGLLLRWKSESRHDRSVLGIWSCYHNESTSANVSTPRPATPLPNNVAPPMWFVLTPVANAAKKG